MGKVIKLPQHIAGKEKSLDDKLSEICSDMHGIKRTMAEYRDRAEFHGHGEAADILRLAIKNLDKKLKLIVKAMGL